MGCPYIYEDWISPDVLAEGVNTVSGSLYVCGKHLDLCKQNKPYKDVEAGAPKGLHHNGNEGACCSPARLPCHHKTFLASFSWGCPEVRTFANKNTRPFWLHLPCLLLLSLPSPRKSTAPHEIILPGVGWAAGICQQPARFCELINDISLSQEEQEKRFLSFCQGRLMGEASEGG